MQNEQANPIRTARLAGGLTQAQLAAAIGVSLTTVSAYEGGHHRPDPTVALRLCRELPSLTLEQVFTMPRLPRRGRHSQSSHPIRLARIAAGLSQDQLGTAVGVTKSSISAYEGGHHRPDPAVALRLCVVLPGLTLERIYSVPDFVQKAA